MNKRPFFIFGGLILLLILSFVLILVNDNRLHKLEDLRPPHQIGSYQERGYFKIDPETILESIESGDINGFLPLAKDEAHDLEELSDLTIYWTQADFLRIVNAVGQYVWNDPMDLKNWNVFDISLMGHCGDALGFDYASISYFKVVENNYTTRIIEIDPRFGLVKWGDGKTYPQPILHKWEGVDLPGTNITADDALQIAIDDLKVNYQIKDNICGVVMRSSRYAPSHWRLDILRGSLDSILYSVDLETGKYELVNANQ
jgi:hypothetical protein